MTTPSSRQVFPLRSRLSSVHMARPQTLRAHFRMKFRAALRAPPQPKGQVHSRVVPRPSTAPAEVDLRGRKVILKRALIMLRGQRPAFEHLLGGKLSIVAIYLGWRVHEVIDPSAKKGNSPHANSDPSSDLDGFGILCHPDGIKTAAEAGCEE